MVFALFVVIYAIKSLNTAKTQSVGSDPNSFVGLLLGGDQRLLNWCPTDVFKVEILDSSGKVQKTLSDANDISSVCELMVGGFVQGEQQPIYSVHLKAYGKDLKSLHELEQAGRESLFRYQGMPFSCAGLVKALERIEAK